MSSKSGPIHILPTLDFGDPLLRRSARRLSMQQINSSETAALIRNMRHTLLSKKLGVAIAAPQVGEGIAIVVIALRPLVHRPHVEPFDLVLINPIITERLGRQSSKWEGCLSSGKGGLFAKVPRYAKVRLNFRDKLGKSQTNTYDGLVAQVMQHEIDHLNGILFVDHVKDTKSYMTMKEYKRRVVSKRHAI